MGESRLSQDLRVTVRYAFLFEGDARGGRRGHDARSGSGCAVHHVDGGQFAFGLHEDAIVFGQVLRHVFDEFILWGDGIAEERFASGRNRRLGNRFVALHEDLGHVSRSTFPP